MEEGVSLGDAYALIKTIPDKSIDLVYTDLPYLMVGGGKGSGYIQCKLF